MNCLVGDVMRDFPDSCRGGDESAGDFTVGFSSLLTQADAAHLFLGESGKWVLQSCGQCSKNIARMANVLLWGGPLKILSAVVVFLPVLVVYLAVLLIVWCAKRDGDKPVYFFPVTDALFAKGNHQVPVFVGLRADQPGLSPPVTETAYSTERTDFVVAFMAIDRPPKFALDFNVFSHCVQFGHGVANTRENSHASI